MVVKGKEVSDVDKNQLLQHYIDACKVVIALTANHTWLDSTKATFGERHTSPHRLQAALLQDLEDTFNARQVFLNLDCSWERLMQSPKLKTHRRLGWEITLEELAHHLFGLKVSEIDGLKTYWATRGQDELYTKATAMCNATQHDDEINSATGTRDDTATQGELTFCNTSKDWAFSFQGLRNNRTLDQVSFLHGSLLRPEESEWILADILSE
jgi:hypothetical protein